MANDINNEINFEAIQEPISFKDRLRKESESDVTVHHTHADTNYRVLPIPGIWLPSTTGVASTLKFSMLDFTGSNLTSIATRLHSDLQNLTVGDDHTQYFKLTGRSGGQTAQGGTGSGENLTLNSTANATKGKIFLGASSAYDELNVRLGIGRTDPTCALEVSSSGSTRLRITSTVAANTPQLVVINTSGGNAAATIYLRPAGVADGYLLGTNSAFLHLGSAASEGGAATANFSINGSTRDCGVQAGHFLFYTNNTQDIGADILSGSVYRPRTIYVGTSIVSPLLSGSITASQNLTLQSTTNATKGKILFGTSGYDEVNNRLGIKNSIPTVELDVTGVINASTGFRQGGAAPSGNVLVGNGTNFVSGVLSGGSITGDALTKVDDTNVTLTLGGTPATALLRATSLTLGWTGQLGLSRGGTNANLSATGGASQVLQQSSAGAAITVGQLAGSDITGAALTKVDDTNVTLTLGGTPATSLLRAASLTLGWTGLLGLSRGGTNANLSATGGAGQVLKQSSVGAAITVGTLAYTSLDFTASNLTSIATRLHSDLQNLTVGDDHTHYLLLAGRATGQTANGGTGASENLTLTSTANATKGKLLVGTYAAFDEANLRFGLGTQSPLADWHMQRESTVSSPLVLFDAYATVVTTGYDWTFRFAHGTYTVPLAVTNNDVVARWGFDAYNAGAFRGMASMRAEVDGAPGATQVPGRFRWFLATDTVAISEMMRLTNSGYLCLTGANTDPRLGIGISSPSYDVHVSKGGVASIMTFMMDSANSITLGPTYLAQYARGTIGAPTVVSSGDILGTFQFNGRGNTAYGTAAKISSVVDGTPIANFVPGSLEFHTAPDTTTVLKRWTMKSQGHLLATSGVGIILPYVVNNVTIPTGFFMRIQDHMETTGTSFFAIEGTACLAIGA